MRRQVYFFYNSQTCFDETINFFRLYYIVIPRTVKIGIYFYNFSLALIVLHKSASTINNSVINTNLFDVQQKLLLLCFFFALHKIPRKMMSAFEINKSIDIYL